MECEIIHDNASLVPIDAYHPVLIIRFHRIGLKTMPFIANVNQRTYNFKKADFPSLYNSILHTDWSFLTHFKNRNLAVDDFYERLYQIFDAHVPVYKTHKRRFPNWYTADIIKNIKKKAKTLKKYRNSHDQNYLQGYKRLRVTVKEQIKIAYDNYVEKAQSSINSNVQNFWSFISSKNNSSRIPAIVLYENEAYTKPQEIVNIFGKFFKSVFLPSELYDSESLEPTVYHDCLNNIGSETRP